MSINTREDSTHGHHKIINTEIRLIIFFAAKYGEALQSQPKQDQELTGSDHEILIVKLRLKLKKVGKNSRPKGHDLNKIPYDLNSERDKQTQGVTFDRQSS